MGKTPFVGHAPPNLINPLLNCLAYSEEYGILSQRAVVGEFLEIFSRDLSNLPVLQDACNFCAVGFCRINPASCRKVNGQYTALPTQEITRYFPPL